jgi:hypothetical protein
MQTKFERIVKNFKAKATGRAKTVIYIKKELIYKQNIKTHIIVENTL